MRRHFYSLAIIAITFLSACSKSSTDPTPDPPTPPEPEIKDSILVTRTKVSYQDVQSFQFPILSNEMAQSLYVGRIINPDYALEKGK